MRRTAILSAALVALSLAAAAGAAPLAGDGSLVVTNGAAPDDTPVVALKKFTGSVIGRVVGVGKIIIDGGPNCDNGQVVGAGRPQSVKQSDTAQRWSGPDFSFRVIGAPGCAYTILVWSGGRASLIASGKGSVRLAGMPDTPSGDGRYSLNDSDFKSLPGTQTAWLAVGDGG